MANTVEPSNNQMNDPEVITRWSADPVWREAQIARAKRARARVYEGFVAPDGTVYRGITELTSFCREHGLQIAKMSEVDAGKRPHHKGWR